MVLEGLPFTGVLYGGLMKTRDGIKVIEFNARFGDPETEVVLPRLKSDIYDIFAGVADGSPVEEPVWDDRATLGIVLASKGYPGSCEKGFPIGGLDALNDPDIRVYHMGTAWSGDGLVTAGGRVLIVVGRGDTLAEARLKAIQVWQGSVRQPVLPHRYRRCGTGTLRGTEVLPTPALFLERRRGESIRIERHCGGGKNKLTSDYGNKRERTFDGDEAADGRQSEGT